MNKFAFYETYYDTLNKIRKREERAKAALAILEFVFENIEPCDLSEAAEIAIESFRKTLEKSKNNSGRGGAPKGNKNACEKNNRLTTELQPINNRLTTDFSQQTTELQPIFLKEGKIPPIEKKETKKRINPLKREESTPLFISPQSGDKKNSFEDEFFATYPRYAKDRDKMRQDVDFKKLLDEFSKSAYLRSLYTVGQINENYALIVAGEFRDKEKPVDKFLAGIEYRAKKERFYSARRSAAESKASAIKNRFMQDETFRAIEHKLKAMVVKIAKAEVQADAGDEKSKKEYAKLKAEESKLLQKRLDILERNGMSEEDLLPKYTCRKCNDTGYTEDGKPCDCYEE